MKAITGGGIGGLCAAIALQQYQKRRIARTAKVIHPVLKVTTQSQMECLYQVVF